MASMYIKLLSLTSTQKQKNRPAYRLYTILYLLNCRNFSGFSKILVVPLRNLYAGSFELRPKHQHPQLTSVSRHPRTPCTCEPSDMCGTDALLQTPNTRQQPRRGIQNRASVLKGAVHTILPVEFYRLCSG